MNLLVIPDESDDSFSLELENDFSDESNDSDPAILSESEIIEGQPSTSRGSLGQGTSWT